MGPLGCLVELLSSSISGRAAPADGYALLRALLTALGPERDFAGDPEQIVREIDLADPSPWQQLVGEADYHGVTLLMAPMVTALAKMNPGAISADAMRVFHALASRHRQQAMIRESAIDRLLEAFAAAGIEVILLKGGVLAHRIYPAPELRPMIDIDVLIDPVQAIPAVRVASELGYKFAPRHPSKFAGREHHIPAGDTVQSGFRIFLELHTDAMHLDQPRRLAIADLASPPQPFRRGAGPPGLALGHTDMLRHLAGHAFDPAHRVRLIHLYDLWRYQAIFRAEIDWQEIETRFPDVMVVLRLVSQMFAADGSSAPCPAGLGFAMMPLAVIAASDMGLPAKLAAVFDPPAWWLHGFYGVPPEKSLLMCRTVRHPAMVVRWLLARAAGYAGVGGDWNWIESFTSRPAASGEDS